MLKPGTNEEALEQRSREVLREIVLRFVATGEPVSSRTLSRGGRFDLSPATLRNVMADLEDLGYLTHPHTSAGRIPTDRGYRFFIDYLMRSRRLTQHEKEAIDEQVAGVNELDDLLQISSKLLNKLSNQVGLVFLPLVPQLSVRSMDFIRVAERRILCVIVGTNGVVLNKVIETSEDLSRDDLEKVSHYITGEFTGLTLTGIRDRLVTMMREERARFDRMLERIIGLGLAASDLSLPEEHELYLEGASSILDKPEFADVEAMRKTLLAFEEKGKLVEILNRCINEEGLQILVGSESQFTSNYNFSLVAARYGTETRPVGLVGIIGPTRMEYGRIAPLVEYLGDALSRKIENDSGERD